VVALRLRQSSFVAAVQDRLGRTIVLEQERWEHCCDHEQLDGHELAVMRVVEDPEVATDGNFAGSKVLYARVGPAKWLAVVVHYDGLSGRVITAYPYNKEPQAAP
jgi:hypothetical protein